MREPSEPEIARAAVRAGVRRVKTTAPGKVVEYNSDTKRATVEMMVDDGDPLAPLPGVPIKFPRGGGYRLVFPLNPGDEVTLHFHKRDPSRFRKTGEKVAPNVQGEFGWYAYAVPGSEAELSEYEGATEDAVHLGTDDGTTEIVVGPGRIDLGALNSQHPVSKGDVADANFSAIYAFLRDHVHPTAVGPTSKAGPTPAAPTLDPVSSDKVFFES